MKGRAPKLQGEWRLLSEGGDAIVLGRTVPSEQVGRGATLVGVIEGPESVPGMLNFLSMNQETGALCVVHGDDHLTLYIHRGKLLSAASSNHQHRLGQILIRQRLITEEQSRLCLAEAAGADRFGRALLRRGILTTHQIYEAMRRQAQEIFAACLVFERGVYYLVKPLDMSAVPAMLHLDVQELLLDGLRRSDELRHLRAVVPSEDAVLAPTQVAPTKALSEAATTLHARIDAETPLSRLLALVGLDELTGTRAAAELIREGCAEILAQQALLRASSQQSDEGRASAAAVIVDVYQEAVRLVLDSLPPASRYEHEGNLALFLETAETYADLLRGVELTPEGNLSRAPLVANACAAAGDAGAMDHLQHCLHELLFFLLFEVGHKRDRELMNGLHRDVGAILAKLPARLAALRTSPGDSAKLA